jgi:rRNA maturation endonuclease Nob1
MVRSDPYTPSEGEYECIGCGHRVSEAGRCPDCGTDLKNISVPRE